jgi:glycosyltransferase involved in cell wall biosynthesis
MRVAAVHNLAPGGAHRRLREQLARLDADVVEVCLSTATPVSDRPHVIAHRPRAPQLTQAARVPVRYVDLAGLIAAWRRAAAMVNELSPDVVYANPCRFLQCPAALAWMTPPALYFCDEPRRVDHDPSAAGSRRRLTRPVYAPMYAWERRLDRRATARASRVATNSRYTAGEITRAYGREAEVLPMGVAQAFLSPPEPDRSGHVLSVGALIPSKGHALVLEASARAGRRPTVIVAPRADPAQAEVLRALATRCGVPLELRVGVEDTELAGLYAGAHATVYMAAREPFGLASLEAQAAGSPVVVAAEGGLPETLAPGMGEWAVARSAEAVADRLIALDDPTRRSLATAAGQAHARQLTWERSAAALHRVLEGLAG